jgi:hypothetical protein
LVINGLINADKVKNHIIKNRILGLKTFRFDFFNRMVNLFPATGENFTGRLVSDYHVCTSDTSAKFF